MAFAEQRQPFSVAARDLLRATLLDALRSELDRRAWADITMADVAKVAGVSRQTLYREFGSRRELGRACVLREADRFLATVEDAVRARRDDPSGALAGAFDAFAATAASNPLVRSLLSRQGADDLLPFVTVEGGPLLELAVGRLGAVIGANWPEAPDAEVRSLAECVVRLGLSHLSLPDSPTQMDGAAIARLLGPHLHAVLDAAD